METEKFVNGNSFGPEGIVRKFEVQHPKPETEKDPKKDPEELSDSQFLEELLADLGRNHHGKRSATDAFDLT